QGRRRGRGPGRQRRGAVRNTERDRQPLRPAHARDVRPRSRSARLPWDAPGAARHIRLKENMAVTHDVMPAFLLLQPGSLPEAHKLLAHHGTDAWILAGGLDSFDWL